MNDERPSLDTHLEISNEIFAIFQKRNMSHTDALQGLVFTTGFLSSLQDNPEELLKVLSEALKTFPVKGLGAAWDRFKTWEDTKKEKD